MSQTSIRVGRAALVVFVSACAVAIQARGTLAQVSPEISRSSEAIHQEIVIAASRDRVYTALTDPQQFTKIVELGPVKNAPPAQIGARAGDPFLLFSGHILGRNIELVPSQRLVQAWRTADWPAGVYSVARFELRGQGAGTLIVFDHTGFPAGESASLLKGWNEHYWDPMKKFLAGGTDR